MTERPILFSAPMVRALLAGTKTQTRRVVKGLHPDCRWARLVGAADWKFYDQFDRLTQATRCPHGLPGDRLWVREAWRITGASPEDTLDMFGRDDVQYRADDDQGYIDKYRPSIHMPRRFSRITLEVTGVRVERLQDISTRDCWAEGIPSSPDVDPLHEYRDLWESINGAGSWDANPWVWVVEFKRAG